MEEVKRIGRKLVQKGHVIDFYEDDILLPDGRIAKWDFLKHKGAAAVVAVRDDGKLLMVRQYRNSCNRQTLEIPAGSRNTEDEDTYLSASRELEEETGYHSDHLELLVRLRTAIAYCDEFIDVYVAQNLVPTKQHLDEDEFLDVEAYTMEELLEMIYDGRIEDTKTISALLAYKIKYFK